MAVRAHIQEKHIIEYSAGSHFTGSAQGAIGDGMNSNGIYIVGQDTDEWEVEKTELRRLRESKAAFDDEEIDDIAELLCEPLDDTKEDLREFLEELIDSDTGEYAYVSWF